MDQRACLDEWMDLPPPAFDSAEEVESHRGIVFVVEALVQDAKARTGVKAETILGRNQELEVCIEPEQGPVVREVDVEGRVKLEDAAEEESPVYASVDIFEISVDTCLLYTSPSPRDS